MLSYEIIMHHFHGTGDLFCTIPFNYRVEFCTVARIVKDVAAAIWESLVREVMPALTLEDWRAIAEDFHQCWNSPRCVGSRDGKHIVIRAPSNSGSLFYNYKGTFSVVLLAVVGRVPLPGR